MLFLSFDETEIDIIVSYSFKNIYIKSIYNYEVRVVDITRFISHFFKYRISSDIYIFLIIEKIRYSFLENK